MFKKHSRSTKNPADGIVYGQRQHIYEMVRSHQVLMDAQHELSRIKREKAHEADEKAREKAQEISNMKKDIEYLKKDIEYLKKTVDSIMGGRR